MVILNGCYIKKWVMVFGFLLMVGVVGGFGVVFFRVLIVWIYDFFFGKILFVVFY